MISNNELQQVLGNMLEAIRGNNSVTYSRNDLAKLLDRAFIEKWQLNRRLKS